MQKYICQSFFTFKNFCILSDLFLLLNFTGFGAPVPRTTAGRTVGVIFAVIGIPAHFLLILNFGVMVAVRLQRYAFARRGARSDNGQSSYSPRSMPRWVKILPFVFSGKYLFQQRTISLM